MSDWDAWSVLDLFVNFLGLELKFSTTNHPQMDGYTERINALLEEFLKTDLEELLRTICLLIKRIGWIAGYHSVLL